MNFFNANKKGLYLSILVGVFLIFAQFQRAFCQSESAFIKGNDAYKSKNYEQAAQLYLSIFNSGKTSVALCYNLGNCYFKLNDFGKSILWYERAKRLAPNDEDVDYNLNVVRLKIVDKTERLPAIFIVNWWNHFRHLFTASAWGVLSLLVFVLFLIAFSFVLFSNSYLYRTVAFYVAVFVFVLFGVSLLTAYVQRNEMLNTNQLIVMEPSCNVKSSPDENSTLLFVIHEGTSALKTDEVGEWIEIKLENNTKGWIKKAEAEAI